MDYEIVYMTLLLILINERTVLFKDEIAYIKKKYTKISRCDGEYCGDENSEYCTTRQRCADEYKAAQKIKKLLEVHGL